MSGLSWNQALITQQVDGTALTNSTTATAIEAAQAKLTIAANSLTIGSTFRVIAAGRISTVTAAPGTLLLELRIGASTVIFSGGAMALNVTAQTNATWSLEAFLTVRADGSVTTVIGVGTWTSRAVIGSGAAGTTGVGVLTLPDTAPVVGTAFDNTASQTLDLYATWSTANAANSIQTHIFAIESLN